MMGLIKLANYFPLPIVMTNKQNMIDLLVIALCPIKTNKRGKCHFARVYKMRVWPYLAFSAVLMTLSANENPFLDKCGYARVEQEEDKVVKEGKHKWHENPE